jgi:hypothetical protein
LLRPAFAVSSLLAALLAPPAGAETPLPPVEIYLPTPCLACIDWGAHLIDNGFKVTYRETADMAALKKRLKVPAEVQSVHTATVGGYFVEGHVPADDVKLLLQEKPRARGIAVPGLPRGAPGRESQGSSQSSCETGCTILDGETREPRHDLYETLLVLPNGKTKTYARH